MVIIRLMGGLGNQLQQYALYEKFNTLGRDVRLDTSWFHAGQQDVLAKRKIEIDRFPGVSYRQASPEEVRKLRGSQNIAVRAIRKLSGGNMPGNKSRFMEKEQYHPEIFDMDGVYLEGFWACEMYYADILPKLREEIVFPETEEDRREQLRRLAGSRTGDCETVSLHIRRGDYLDAENKAMFEGICTQQYYSAALGYIKEHVQDPHFFIFTDDPGYAVSQYKGNEYTVVDVNHGDDSYKDIGLMSVCSHNICANSTFSFWGARLNRSENKIQIRPSVHKNSQVCVPERMHEWWKDWTIITPGGETV